ncbi:MAG: tetratricopeptide repeat protein [Myxococcales bacterium]|nr:tetratricopeptide repeat protein [Myxococcales bacterium]
MSDQIKELRERAQEAAKARDVDTAMALYREAAAIEGFDIEGSLRQGLMLLESNDVQKAVELLLRVVQACPLEVDALLGLARVSIFLGKLQDAENYLFGAERLDPENATVFAIKGLLYEIRGQLAEALACAEKAASLHSNDFIVTFNYGRLLGQDRRYEEAAEQLKKAIQQKPDSYEAHYALGITYVQRNLLSQAVAAFESTLKIAPENPDAYATLADVLVRANDVEQAIEVLDEGLRYCGEHPGLLEKKASLVKH